MLNTPFDPLYPPQAFTRSVPVHAGTVGSTDNRIGNLHPNRLLHSRETRTPPQLHYSNDCVSPVAVLRRENRPARQKSGSSLEDLSPLNVPTPPSPPERPMNPPLTVSRPIQRTFPDVLPDPRSAGRMLPPSAQFYRVNDREGHRPALHEGRPAVGNIAWAESYTFHNVKDSSLHPLATRPLPPERMRSVPHDSPRSDEEEFPFEVDHISLCEEDEEKFGNPYIPSTPNEPVSNYSSRNADLVRRKRKSIDTAVQGVARPQWPSWNVSLHQFSPVAPSMWLSGGRAPEVPPRMPMPAASGGLPVPQHPIRLDSFFSESLPNSGEDVLLAARPFVPETPDASVPAHQTGTRRKPGFIEN